MSLTPHGPGFSFLDAFEIIHRGPGGTRAKMARSVFALLFADHFPGEPLMPGVLLIECGAQTAGALWASMQTENAPVHFILAQVMQFKIQHPVMPGEIIETDVVLENSLGSLAQFGVTLRVNQVEVARGRLVLSKPGQDQAGN